MPRLNKRTVLQPQLWSAKPLAREALQQVAAAISLPPIEAALTRPAPRRVRTSRWLRNVRYGAVNLIAACVAVYALAPTFPALADFRAFCWLVILPCAAWLRREAAAREQKRFLRNGVAVRAVVLDRRKTLAGKSDWYAYSVAFGFVTGAGEAVTRTIEVDRARYMALGLDRSATLLYLASDPWKAQPYFALTDAELE